MTPEFDAAQLARWCGGQWTEQPPAPLRGFSFDTRSLRPGDLFFALRSPARDGHAYLKAAQQAGAAAAMIDQPDRSVPGLPCLLVPDVQEGMTALARAHRASFRGTVVAVTGSVGKTTVKDLIGTILALAAPTTRSPANWNNHIGVPMSLLQSDPAAAFGVFEIGMNHPGELDPLASLLRPQVGVVTRVGPVHIEAFGSVADIAHEKAAVYRGLSETGTAILNLDSPEAGRLRSSIAGPVVTVSGDASVDADYHYERTVGSPDLVIRDWVAGETQVMTSSVPGGFMAENIAIAVAVCRTCGLGYDPIREGVAQFHPQGMRWRRETVAGVDVINDAYNANPVSMTAAIRAFLEESTRGGRWTVLGGMLELGDQSEAAHRDLGAWIATLPIAGLVTVGPLAQPIAEAASASGLSRVYPEPDHASAAACLAQHTRPGDLVLLKGSRGAALENLIPLWALQQKETWT
ncbi:MAG: UDP-N-acetylmuramoyl-tripeptide--D-alanyl-D-alanine ligase [Kiritimatiellae bacterium]|nr:UDP-N-acetylmuramoyl-tripeptide--D-alanyl-D-alanine ligase [Kiritimatiellia bacterium]